MGFNQRKPNIFDAYVILPIILYEGGSVNLKRVTSRSSLYSVFLKDNVVGLAGLESRMNKLCKHTIDSIIFGYNMEWLSINNKTFDIQVNATKCEEIKKKIMKERRLYKEAFNLGKILSKNEVQENYRLMEVKNLCFAY